MIRSTASFVLGVAIGAGAAIAAANLWPHARMAPVLFTENNLRFGATTSGEPALCDEEGRAFGVAKGNAGLYTIAEWRGDVLTAMKCEAGHAR